MEFWGIEVKSGKTVNVKPGDDKFLHLSQASLGELKGKENVVIYVKVDDQKLVLGTLSSEKCPQIPFDLAFEKEFELSHTSKNTSVYFVGYKIPVGQEDEFDPEDYSESESEPEEAPVGQNANGKAVAKQDQGQLGARKSNAVREDNSAAKKAKKAEPVKVDKPKMEEDDDDEDDEYASEESEDDKVRTRNIKLGARKANAVREDNSAAKKAKKAEPVKVDKPKMEEDDDDEDDEYASEESEDDKDMVEAMSDSDDEDEDESSEEDDEATPKKAVTGKRPANDSASKTPASEKKAKVVTPADQKTGGDKKKHVHVATPHPSKQVGKTSGNSDKSKQQTPKSAGSVVCKSCSRTFNSDNALQAHTKAKHG